MVNRIEQIIKNYFKSREICSKIIINKFLYNLQQDVFLFNFKFIISKFCLSNLLHIFYRSFSNAILLRLQYHSQKLQS